MSEIMKWHDDNADERREFKYQLTQRDQRIAELEAKVDELEVTLDDEEAAHVDQFDCEAGCVPFTGGERRHHSDCKHYPESMTKMLDDAQQRIAELEAENKRLQGRLFVAPSLAKTGPHEPLLTLDQWESKLTAAQSHIERLEALYREARIKAWSHRVNFHWADPVQYNAKTEATLTQARKA